VLGKTKMAPLLSKTKFEAAKFAELIIEENYRDEDFRRILGINIFDDVAWFNKEGFEDALFYSSLFYMVDRSVGIPAEERIERITQIYEVLTKAEDKSGYRFDNLFDSLTTKPVRKSPVKEGAKPSETAKKDKGSKAVNADTAKKSVKAKPVKETTKAKPAKKTSEAKPVKAKPSKEKSSKGKTSGEKTKKEKKQVKPKGKKK
jgi:hypothetical protein